MADRTYYAHTTDKWSTNIVTYDLQPIEAGGPEIDEPKICNETRYPLLHRCYQCSTRFIHTGDHCVFCGASLSKAAIYGALIVFFARLQFPTLMPAEAAAAGYAIDQPFLSGLFPLLSSLDVPALKATLDALGLDDLLGDIAKIEADTAVLELLATSNDPALIGEAIKELIEK